MWGRVSPRELAWRLQALAILLEAGLPQSRALATLACCQAGKGWPVVLRALVADLQTGMALSTAMAAWPRYFDHGICLAIAAGESSGAMVTTLGKLADERVQRAQLHDQLRSALFYPAMVGVLAIGLLLFMSLMVVPVLAQTFAGAGQALPWPTRLLLDFSSAIGDYGLLGGLGVLALVATLRHYVRRWAGWAEWRDGWLLALPWFGPLFRQVALSRWSRHLGLLLSAGVPLLYALTAAGEASDNRMFAVRSTSLAEQVRAGSRLALAMQAEAVFPDLLLQLVAVGEQSGMLALLLERAALHYEAEFGRQSGRLLRLVEPLAMLLLGLICALLIWALYLPVFQLGEMIF